MARTPSKHRLLDKTAARKSTASKKTIGSKSDAAKTAALKKESRPAAPYHHGALREALLTAAERILERDGLPGLTLRAVAREAGVSHAAPTHHFGDLTGLLSDLAAVGFARFREAMAGAAGQEIVPEERLNAMGSAYIAFARASPGLFTLMFRSERLDPSRPALAEAMNAAGAALAQAIGARRHEVIEKAGPSLQQAAEIVRAWSMVHGFAVLLLDGRLGHILARLPTGENEQSLIKAMLAVRPDGTGC
jgi:AcrR family transcriptional regulator